VRPSFLVLAVVGLAACGGHATQPAPVAGESASPVVPTPASDPEDARACARLKVLIADVLCEPGVLPCKADQVPCALAADLDGNGVDEQIAVTAAGDGDAITLGVHWADGRRELVATTARPLRVGETDETIDEFGWLITWHVVRRADAREVVGTTDGDLVIVDGGDAAAALYRRNGAFAMEHLGY
jgi:hypothetical protein